MAVHLTRPKTSKGRRTPTKTLNFSQNSCEINPQQSGGGSLFSDEFGAGGVDTLLRPQSRHETRHPGYLSQNQAQENKLPDGCVAGKCMNKYKVLPSIEKGKGSPKHSDHVGKEVADLRLTRRQIFKSAEGCAERDHTSGHLLGTSSSEDDRKVALSPDTLLLAIKDPAGRRFERRFRPSDTLLHLRASAEALCGVKFGEKTMIETMEVPRRSFNDMSPTLAQCGISNKSVLCIFQSEDE